MNQLDPSALSLIASFLIVDDVDALKYTNRKTLSVFGSGIRASSLVDHDFSYLFTGHDENSDLEREWTIFEDRFIPSILVQLNFLEQDYPISHVLNFMRHLVGEKNFKQLSSTEADITINWGSEGRSCMELIFKEIDALSSINLKHSGDSKDQSIREILTNWRNMFCIDENSPKLNPFRLFKKFKIKIQGYQDTTMRFEDRPRPIRRKNCINVTNSYVKSYSNEYEMVMFEGCIKNDYETCYTYDKLSREKFEKFDEKCRLILFDIFRFKLIPLMEEFEIDLRKFLDKNTIQAITKYINNTEITAEEKQKKLYRFFTTQYNILEAYRTQYLNGRISPQSFSDKEMQDLEVVLTCFYFDLIRMNFDNMNNKQRMIFFETFTKHMLKSQLMISDELLEEYGKRMNRNVDKQFSYEKKKENIKCIFHTLEFQRVIGIVRGNVLQFPTKATSSCFKSIEWTRPKDCHMTFNTKKGKLNDGISKVCCSHWFTSLCSLTVVLSSWCCTYPCCYEPQPIFKKYKYDNVMGNYHSDKMANYCANCCTLKTDHKYLPVLDLTVSCLQLSNCVGLCIPSCLGAYAEHHEQQYCDNSRF